MTDIFNPLIRQPNAMSTQISTDDLSGIRQIYHLEALSYVDIFAKESVLKITKKWALIAELTASDLKQKE